jgi:hypothetical protein
MRSHYKSNFQNELIYFWLLLNYNASSILVCMDALINFRLHFFANDLSMVHQVSLLLN